MMLGAAGEGEVVVEEEVVVVVAAAVAEVVVVVEALELRRETPSLHI